MGFWDYAKDAARLAGNYAKSQLDDAQKYKERVQEYKERYEDLDDDTLFRKYRNSSGAIKTACGLLLKERGFHPDN